MRAGILTALGDVAGAPESIPLYVEALRYADDDGLLATIHSRLASAMRWGAGVERRIHHAELAVNAASRVTGSICRLGRG